MKTFVLVISMWGFNGSEWVYMGNQFVNNNPMSKSQCEALIVDDQWTRHIENEYYDIQFDCFEAGKKI
mgnify:CR=1 FL=1